MPGLVEPGPVPRGPSQEDRRGGAVVETEAAGGERQVQESSDGGAAKDRGRATQESRRSGQG